MPKSSSTVTEAILFGGSAILVTVLALKCAYQNVGRRVLKQLVLPSYYFKAKMFEMFSRFAISLAV
jgi:hypothetical protein